MRHGRAKAARKTLQFFARQGVSPPFFVVVDGTFLVQLILHKVPLQERLEKLLQHSKYTLYTTRSSLNELATLEKHAPETKREAIQQARQWGLNECEIIESSDIPHQHQQQQDTTYNSEEEELGEPAMDILRLVQSRNESVVVATQDETLLDRLRNVGECPLVRLSRGVLLLENPSKAAQQRAQRQETTKYSSANRSEVELAKSAAVQKEEQPQQQSHARRKRKAKGPNPLSCKKKKTTMQESSTKRKRRKRHKTTTTSSSVETHNAS